MVHYERKDKGGAVLESWLFLILIGLVALFGKNQSLIIATGVVLALKLIPKNEKIFELIHGKGINWGVTIISIAILIPIATGEIGLKDLWHSFKSPLGWLAVFCGILVAILSAKGVNLIAQSPEVTVSLVIGTIIGVVFLKGIAAGPVIASGITYYMMQVIMSVTGKF